MGEYAKHNGQEIKIGTCENMYYLRFDQRALVQAMPGNVDPMAEEVHELRFRFPWPDEDMLEPGANAFHANGYHRAIAAHGMTVPAGVDHSNVQFRADAGYLLSLPCPEGPEAHAGVWRNGFSGAVQLVAQKLLRDGRLVPVCRCGGCGAMWRMETPSDIEALAVAFRSEADRREHAGSFNGTGKQDRKFFDAIADRILEGAGLAVLA
jgi:hypothetical protein